MDSGSSTSASSSSESDSEDESVSGVATNGDVSAVDVSPKTNGDVIPDGDTNGYRHISYVDVKHGNGLPESVVDIDQDDNGEDEDHSVTVITLNSDIVTYLGAETDNAEARLAAKRQARAEAREIRMRELEKQQRDSEENDSSSTTPLDGTGMGGRSSRLNSLTPRLNSYQSSRRSSEDSLEETNSIREIRAELRETEDKFRKAMIGNAQLDNEKASALYQVELYKDRYEELEEAFNQLSREHRERGRELELIRRDLANTRNDLAATVDALRERDTLIQEQGLVIVGGEDEYVEGDEERPKRALVSVAGAEMLSTAGPGSIDSKLKRLVAERAELQDELQHCRLELEEERARSRAMTSTDSEAFDREVNKQIGDYKFKLQKAEQDVSTLQTTVARLEGQVTRYKTSSESLEKVEAALKTERRKLLRELRESQARVEELETAHSHLQKRLDKLKNAKSALLKDL